MTTHSVRYEALSQVSLSRSDSSVNFVGTERLISGQTLRGAMAALWWRQPGADPAGFASLFDTDLSVSQAVPLGAVLRSAAAHVCKYLSSPACKTVLVDDAVLDLSGHAAVEECWECSGPLEADSGWGSLPNTTVRTRSSLDADETSEDGHLFTREYLPAGTEFTGTITSSAPLDWLNGKVIRIGSSKSTGPGRMKVTLFEPHPGTDIPAVSGRRVLRVMSPVILLDEYGGPTLSSEALTAELIRVSGIQNLTVTAKAGWLRSTQVQGFHGRSLLPRKPDWGLAAGSTFIVDNLTTSGWERLARGIGWRTIDGFGQLMVAESELVPAMPEPRWRRIWTEQAAMMRGDSRNWGAIKGNLKRFLHTRTTTSEQLVGDAAVNAACRILPPNSPRPYQRALEAILAMPSSDLVRLSQALQDGSIR